MTDDDDGGLFGVLRDRGDGACGGSLDGRACGVRGQRDHHFGRAVAHILDRGVDVLIATPGRLLDQIEANPPI